MRLNRLFSAFSLVLLACGIPQATWAATLTVTNATDGAVGSLRERIQASTSGDTIVFHSSFAGGTLVLTNDILLNKSLTITATNLAGGVTLDAGSGTNRILLIFPSGLTNVISGITFTGGDLTGSGSPGAAIFMVSSNSLTLSQCSLTSNRAGGASAIYAEYGVLSLSNCIVSGNVATDSSGAFELAFTQFSANHCRFIGNTAPFGGALNCFSGTLSVSDCTFMGNTGTLAGGVAHLNGTAATIVDSLAIQNFGHVGGAFLFTQGSSASCVNCTVAANTVSANGGGIALTLSSSVNLSHCTIANNSAAGNGGGILGSTSTISLSNTIVAGNSAGLGADIRNELALVREGTNIVQAAISGGGSITGSGTILAVDPLLGSLTNNGGATMTMALLPGSPALDGAGGSTETTDQRGYLRPREGNNSGSALPDIGAVEMQSAPSVGAEKIMVTVAADELDSGGTGISLREALTDNSTVGTVLFDPAVFNGESADVAVLSSGRGEVAIVSPSVTIDGSANTGGVTIAGGGGSNRVFYVPSSSQVSLFDLTIRGGNGYGAILPGNGGAILNQGILTVTRCAMVSNFVPASGGAIYSDGTLTLVNSTLARNTATDNGAGVFHNAGTLTFDHVTVVSNAAVNSGGGVAIASGNASLQNSIVANNNAGTGADIVNLGTLQLSGANIAPQIANFATQTGPAPLTSDPLLRAPGNYGGRSLTMPPFYTSPALDAAISSTATNDQRGEPRAVDADLLSPAAADLGAVELQLRSFVVTNGTDVGQGTLRRGVTAASTNVPDITWITFANAFNGSTIVLTNRIIHAFGLPLVDAMNLSDGLTIQSAPGAASIFSVVSGILDLRGVRLTGNPGTAVATSPGDLRMYACEIASNTFSGGCLSISDGSLDIRHSTISENSTVFGGGAIALSGSRYRIENCTLTANLAGFGGGALYALSSTGLMRHTTVALNTNTSGSIPGGGIYIASGILTTAYSIVYGNTDSSGYLPSDFYSGLGTVVAVGTNLVQSFANDGGVFTGSGVFANDNPQLGDLADNGGRTRTRALLAGSAALDRAGGSATTLDQRHLPRSRDGDNNGSGISDVGALEMQTPPALGVEQQLVTTPADELNALDVPGAGRSLREAVNDPLPSGLVAFDPAVFNGEVADRIVLSNTLGQIVLSNNVQVSALNIPGGVTVDGGPGSNRVLRVPSGVTAVVQRLTLTGGGGYPDSGNGGAILNGGTLTLANCLVVSNKSDSSGGGIANQRRLNLLDSTASFNDSLSGGGGIQNGFSAVLVASNSTIYGNDAWTGLGGGLINDSGGTSLLTHCTFTENLATNFVSGGGIYRGGGTVILANSIVASNRAFTSPDIEGGVTVSGANITNGNPRLAPLGDYGGLTPTVALLPGSPARNASVGSTRTVDQRGFPTVGTADIGAYEAGTFSNFNAWIWESLTNTLANHTAGGDPDGDFVSNNDEWNALTDPGNIADYLRALSIGETNVTFPSVLNRTYRLQQSPSLLGGWSNSIAAPIAGDGTIRSFALPSVDTQQYFRVEAGP